MSDKCDDCRKWALGCELDGDFRRYCIKLKYKYFKPKKESESNGNKSKY